MVLTLGGLSQRTPACRAAAGGGASGSGAPVWNCHLTFPVSESDGPSPSLLCELFAETLLPPHPPMGQAEVPLGPAVAEGHDEGCHEITFVPPASGPGGGGRGHPPRRPRPAGVLELVLTFLLATGQAAATGVGLRASRANRIDEAVLASLVDSEDVTPVVRAAFERGHPEVMVDSLKSLAVSGAERR